MTSTKCIIESINRTSEKYNLVVLICIFFILSIDFKIKYQFSSWYQSRLFLRHALAQFSGVEFTSLSWAFETLAYKYWGSKRCIGSSLQWWLSFRKTSLHACAHARAEDIFWITVCYARLTSFKCFYMRKLTKWKSNIWSKWIILDHARKNSSHTNQSNWINIIKSVFQFSSTFYWIYIKNRENNI